MALFPFGYPLFFGRSVCINVVRRVDTTSAALFVCSADCALEFRRATFGCWWRTYGGISRTLRCLFSSSCVHGSGPSRRMVYSWLVTTRERTALAPVGLLYNPAVLGC